MFELPAIECIGSAKDVVLGISSVGVDMDGSWVIPDLEFLSDWDVTPSSMES